MEKKIAVLSDSSGAPASLQEAENVVIYERMGQFKKNWQEISRLSFFRHNAGTPEEIRRLGESIADKLGEIKVILGSDISGISYLTLNRYGFLLCESKAISDELLDDLFEELEADEDVPGMDDARFQGPHEREAAIRQKTAPGECRQPGHFFIDLRDAQKSNPSLSSKKILRPFFTDTLFVELVILCDHQPPWLETDLPRLGLALTCDRVDSSTLRLRVTHVSCQI